MDINLQLRTEKKQTINIIFYGFKNKYLQLPCRRVLIAPLVWYVSPFASEAVPMLESQVSHHHVQYTQSKCCGLNQEITALQFDQAKLGQELTANIGYPFILRLGPTGSGEILKIHDHVRF